MWKFHNFSITQILRENKFGDSTRAITTILTHLEALNNDFDEFLRLLRAENDQNQNSWPQNTAKMTVLETLKWPQLISRKI